MQPSRPDTQASRLAPLETKAGLDVYHLHPLVAGPLSEWPGLFLRIAEMGFSHVCLAPPFEPGTTGDIFAHATFDRLHPALNFDGPADRGLHLIAHMARQAGLLPLLDIAPAQVAVGSPIHSHNRGWFPACAREFSSDPRRAPSRIDTVTPRFSDTIVAEAVGDWWSRLVQHLLGLGVVGLRCLTLKHVPRSIWRRIIGAAPGMSFLAWVTDEESLAQIRGVGFTFACVGGFRSADSLLRSNIGVPRLAAPEPSFLDRLANHLPPDTDIAAAYRFAVRKALATSDGLFIPMGFEYGTRRAFDSVRATPADFDVDRPTDLSSDIASAIRTLSALPPAHDIQPITGAGAKVAAFVRGETLIVINPDLVHSVPLGLPLTPLPSSELSAIEADETALYPGEVRILSCCRQPDVLIPGPGLTRDWGEWTRIAIEAIRPGPEFPAKAIIGRDVVVAADIVADGHDQLAAELCWRAADCPDWRRTAMRLVGNDRWEARIRPDRIGPHQYRIEAWWDEWATFTHDLHTKLEAGRDVALEIQEGAGIVQAALGKEPDELTAEALLADSLADAMKRADRRPFLSRSAIHVVRVDRVAAEFASWYELFPRSVTHDAAVHGTFRSVIERLPDIQAMGFDVLYFPPIHPIGRINRKGRNNALRAVAADVGSPYAIGAAEGGHDAIHPELGTLDDFRALIEAARAHGLELAIDFAVQCAPDHPWIAQHKDWFRWRPDGSMRYAENPPKKYEDIVNPDFYGRASFPDLWIALRDVIQFWVDQGVRTFRVDNPHTKPLPFWQWMIADIQGRNPGALFLAEAFTRPKLMYRLAGIGFTQSYTYFTWRNTKQEITEYLTELNRPPASEFFRPNFFVNTPDINPVFLQTSGRPGFLIRAALAATLSGLWGVYSGFEICEAAPLPGREEYLDSEKYEIRPRDYNAPGNIVAEITALNRIRRQHPALQTHLGLVFHAAYDDQIILYSKRDPIDGSLVLVAVSFDPLHERETTIEVPLWLLGLSDDAAVGVVDLMREDAFTWYGKYQRLRLDPNDLPFAIWRLQV